MFFGPAGNSDRFYEEGYKSSVQAPEWLQNMGLTAYEYSFGRGVSISLETAARVREEARAHHIAVSVHAPYFIWPTPIRKSGKTASATSWRPPGPCNGWAVSGWWCMWARC